MKALHERGVREKRGIFQPFLSEHPYHVRVSNYMGAVKGDAIEKILRLCGGFFCIFQILDY